MFNIFVPDFVYSSLYEIEPEKLAALKIHAVFMDLDGTMASRHAPLPPQSLKLFLKRFTDCGIKVLILSNNKEDRVALFCRELPVTYLSRARKPFPSAFIRASQITGYSLRETAVIGDQIYTDTFGGNRVGAMTIYVESLDKYDFWIHVRYQLERGFVHLGRKGRKSEN